MGVRRKPLSAKVVATLRAKAKNLNYLILQT